MARPSKSDAIDHDGGGHDERRYYEAAASRALAIDTHNNADTMEIAH